MNEVDVKRMFDEVRAFTNAMSHPKAPEVIAQVMDWEAASVKQGEPAPDFTLPWLHGPARERGEALTLSSHFGKRPVALVFGSYT